VRFVDALNVNSLIGVNRIANQTRSNGAMNLGTARERAFALGGILNFYSSAAS
jgi:hypothetical protein